jgi:molybdenum cofactor biosynthesis enzyme MoaA
MKLKVNSCDGIYKDSLDVRFTKDCNNNCPFCIERSGINSLGQTNVRELARETINTGRQDILILGGEPFLYPYKLLLYIKLIRPYVRNIYITTSLPKSIDVRNDTIREILDNIQGLNVSLQHYDWKKNNQAMRADNHNRIAVLEKILSNKKWAAKTRVSINLIKGYIDSYLEIINALRMLQGIGCKHVKLNELQNVDSDTYVSFEDIMRVKLKSPYAHGCQTDVTKVINCFLCDRIYMKVELKRSCFLVQDKSIAKASVPDLIKSFIKSFMKSENTCKVLYEDGTLSDGWRIKS